MKWIYPIYNIYASFCNITKLPRPGEKINFFYIALLLIKNNDKCVFNKLLNCIYNDNIGKGYSYMSLGIHSRNPLIDNCRKLPHILYKSRIYLAYWEDGKKFINKIDNKIPYLELGTL